MLNEDVELFIAGYDVAKYVDVPFAAIVTDYKGKKKLCYEKSYIHLEPTGYIFNMAIEYLDYLAGVTLNCE